MPLDYTSRMLAQGHKAKACHDATSEQARTATERLRVLLQADNNSKPLTPAEKLDNARRIICNE